VTYLRFKYIANTQQTVSFEEAPCAVRSARQLITERARLVVPDVPLTFNEILSAAYMEKQKMSVSPVLLSAARDLMLVVVPHG
jgi:hypothetical protein